MLVQHAWHHKVVASSNISPTSSRRGSEAADNAIKIARVHTRKPNIIAFEVRHVSLPHTPKKCTSLSSQVLPPHPFVSGCCSWFILLNREVSMEGGTEPLHALPGQSKAELLSKSIDQ